MFRLANPTSPIRLLNDATAIEKLVKRRDATIQHIVYQTAILDDKTTRISLLLANRSLDKQNKFFKLHIYFMKLIKFKKDYIRVVASTFSTWYEQGSPAA